MPSFIFKSNGLKALDLWLMSNRLKGDDTAFRVRKELREAILDIWPEIDGERTFADNVARQKAIENEIRDIEITPEFQSALSEGFLKLIRDHEIDDMDKHACINLSKLCGFSKWLNRHISKGTAKEFKESDDAVELDPPEDGKK